MALEQRIDGIDDRIDKFDQKFKALQKGTNDDFLELSKKWNARWDELRQSLQTGSKENQQRIREVEDQMQVLQSSAKSHHGFPQLFRGYSWKCYKIGI